MGVFEVDARHGLHSVPKRWEHDFCLGSAVAALALGVREIVRREIDVGGMVVLTVLLFAVPAAGLAIMLVRASRWWRHGRLMAGPDGLRLVDGHGREEVIAAGDVTVYRYAVVFTSGEGYAHAPEPYAVVEGSASGQPLVLAGEPWKIDGTELCGALGRDAGEQLEVQDWEGLESRHPGFRRFGTTDTGIELMFWMIGSSIWAGVIWGLAELASP